MVQYGGRSIDIAVFCIYCGLIYRLLYISLRRLEFLSNGESSYCNSQTAEWRYRRSVGTTEHDVSNDLDVCLEVKYIYTGICKVHFKLQLGNNICRGFSNFKYKLDVNIGYCAK